MYLSSKTSIVTLLLMLAVNAHCATKHAIVVGVSDYPYLSAKAALDGPKNDIEVVMDYLLDNDFSENDIILLADDELVKPTHKNILEAFNKTLLKSDKGDFVYLHFSGHGSQQPQTDTSNKNLEYDGLDEIFLPRDVKGFNYQIGKVENALVDNEINYYVTKFRQKGVFVWLVFDSCHAGTMMRAVNIDGVKQRKLDPAVLNIPADAITKAKSQNNKKPGQQNPLLNQKLTSETDKQELAGYVAFYAAQSTEPTIEMKLPKESPDKRPIGLFTYTIGEILGSNMDISYQQLAEGILYRYALLNSTSTPVFEGTNINATVFNKKDKTNISQWKVTPENNKLILRAGQINGINTGSILALVQSPTKSHQAVLGYIKVLQSSMISSKAKSIAHKGLKPIEIIKPLYARPINRKVSTLLSLSLQANNSEQGSMHYLQSALKNLARSKKQSINLALVKNKSNADFNLFLDKSRLWFIPSSGLLKQTGRHKTFSLKFTPTSNFIDALTQSLRTLSRVKLLHNINKLSNSNNSLSDIEVNFALRSQDKTSSISPYQKLSLVADDKIEVSITNKGNVPVDVTALFIDGGFGITPIFPAEIGASNRIQPNSQPIKIIDAKITADTLGSESLIIVAVKAEPNMQRTDLSFLAQASLASAKLSRSMMEKKTSLENALRQGATHATANNQSSSAIWSYHWEVAE